MGDQPRPLGRGHQEATSKAVLEVIETMKPTLVPAVPAMLVALQLVGVAAVPLKVTVLVPCVAPKVVPVTVTDVPTGPNVVERLPMAGGGIGVGTMVRES